MPSIFLTASGLDPAEVNRNPTSALSQTMDVMLRNNMNRQKSQADLLISVDLKGFRPTDFGASKQIIAIGEKAGQEKIATLKELANSLRSYPGLSLKEPPRYPINDIKIQGVSGKDKGSCTQDCGTLAGFKARLR
ncbi:hypothetical protein MASR2M78_07440 [Treponema sp.]